MAGIHGGFSGKGQDFFANTGKEQIPVPARQVPSTHAVGKENIPAEKLILIGKIETKASGAVAGNEQEFGPRPWVRDWA